jgi:hypothetical protein
MRSFVAEVGQVAELLEDGGDRLGRFHLGLQLDARAVSLMFALP